MIVDVEGIIDNYYLVFFAVGQWIIGLLITNIDTLNVVAEFQKFKF